MRWRWWFRELAEKRKPERKEGRRQRKERKGLGFSLGLGWGFCGGERGVVEVVETLR
jgi:hypothetical protein